MNPEPIRVLHIVGRMDRGGIETMIMNLYRHVDREQVQFDFLAHYGREAAYNEEIRAMGGRIYEMPALRDDTRIYYWRVFSYLRALNRFFKAHREYRIIHGHMTNTAALYMPIARRWGVTCRIAHSHSTRGKGGLMGLATYILHRPVYRFATHCFACSQGARGWLYPRRLIDAGQVHILSNAVDAARFRFDPESRRNARQALEIHNQTVILCAGLFRPEKNQSFLMDVLREMLKTRRDILFLFAGDGPCEAEVREKAARYGIMDHARFLGVRQDMPALFHAADAFVMPSLWEGLPLTALEAQASGLPGVVSDAVTREMDLFGLLQYVPLSAGPKPWAEALLRAAAQPRRDTFQSFQASGFDVRATAPWLQSFYLANHNREVYP